MFFFSWYEKGLLNFVTERKKLVYRINNARLAFKTSKTTIYRPHTPELKSISKFQLLFHWRNFEKYMVFYTLPWSRWNRIHTLWHTCVVPFALAELGHMSWSSSHTKICTRYTAASLYSAFESWRYFNVILLNTFRRNKRRKNCEESRWLSPIALVWPSAKSLTVRSQNLIGSYVSTHSTFNLIGPCNRHPNIQSQKATKIHPNHRHMSYFFKITQKGLSPFSPLFLNLCVPINISYIETTDQFEWDVVVWSLNHCVLTELYFIQPLFKNF